MIDFAHHFRHAFHADCLADANVCSVCCKSGKYDSNYTYYYKDKD
jgi:hypothetical protein